MNLPYKTKRLVGEIKDIDMEKRIVEGYFSAFDFVDSDGDLLKRGCYSKTIKENGPKGKGRIMHLLQHDPTKPLGKPMELYEDDYGVKFTTVISETSYGSDTMKLYRDKVLKEHSVGINIIKAEYSEEDRANVVTEVKMWEGSTVTWGANEMALGGMKGNHDDILDKYNTLCKAWHTGDYTDDTFMIIEKQKEHYEQLIRKSLVSEEPSDDTPSEEADLIKQFFEEKQLKTELKSLLL